MASRWSSLSMLKGYNIKVRGVICISKVRHYENIFDAIKHYLLIQKIKHYWNYFFKLMHYWTPVSMSKNTTRSATLPLWYFKLLL